MKTVTENLAAMGSDMKAMLKELLHTHAGSRRCATDRGSSRRGATAVPEVLCALEDP
jgi:hypothetical protein